MKTKKYPLSPEMNEIKIRTIKENTTLAALAKEMGMNRSTLWTKMVDGGGGLTIQQVRKLKEYLNYSAFDITEIFLLN